MIGVPMGSSLSPEGGAPRVLFRTGAPRFNNGQIYAVTKDGNRFLVTGRPQKSVNDPLTVVVNWDARPNP